MEAAAGGTLPVERAASLLAMHCLVRGLTPCDYTVLVVPRGTLLDSVGQRAQELLELGRAIGTGVRLSPREREVLECVLLNKSNKEIASRLNICERTVKFHVSGLLAKFNVRDRIGLMREATIGLQPAASSEPADALFGFPMPANSGTGTRPAQMREREGEERLRFLVLRLRKRLYPPNATQRTNSV